MRHPKVTMAKDPSQHPSSVRLGISGSLMCTRGNVHKDANRPSMCPHDVLDLHEAGEVGAVHLRKAHGDLLDGVREVGDEDIFKGVDPAPGSLYPLCQKLDALFRLGELDHQRQGL